MINEEINDQSFSIAARIAEVSFNEIRKAIEKLLADLGSGKYSTENIKNTLTGKKPGEVQHGQMTLKQLSKHHDGLSTIELTDPNLRLLAREMKKHNIDFAAVKDGKGKYTLFFKGKDVDSVTHALKRYTQQFVRREKGSPAEKPSIGKELAEAKEAAKVLNIRLDKVKNRSRGELAI